MDNFLITGGVPLHGEITIAGAKNVTLKALVASLLTDSEVIIHNAPSIRDVSLMLDLLRELGIKTSSEGHTITVHDGSISKTTVPLEVGAKLRVSSMVLGPILARYGNAKIPNPGGCRIGARPIDRHIEGLVKMGATITYNSDDGYFHAKANGLHGVTYRFSKNTHTGTETLLLAAVLAHGETVLKNAAEEVEVDDLISLLNRMGANIKRTNPREIVISGVEKLHGTEYTVMPDRNEEVTFALTAMTGGEVTVRHSRPQFLSSFLEQYTNAGGIYKKVDDDTTVYSVGNALGKTDIATGPYPGFMTDWQGPWAVFMTQAHGISTIHETVFESRFSYVIQLQKMGAQIDFFDPIVANPQDFYNFNWSDRVPGYHQGIRITGPTKLHNAVTEIDDLRAGATLVLAALAATGESYISGIEQIDRGYEKIEERLSALGANIKRVKE